MAITLGNPKTILILRTDAIGDNVLASGMLEPIRKAFPTSKIVFACQDRVADLYEFCPHVDVVVSFSRGRAYADEGYRQEVLGKMKAVGAEVVLNPVLSREKLSDALCAGTGAAVRVGFETMPGEREGLGRRVLAYTNLISPIPGWHLELSRATEFLAALGISGSGRPEVWLHEDDLAFADDYFKRRKWDPAETTVAFAGALVAQRVNHDIGSAMGDALFTLPVIAIGAAHEFAINQSMLENFAGPAYNLSGYTTLRQTAALLQRCRLAVGS